MSPRSPGRGGNGPRLPALIAASLLLAPPAWAQGRDPNNPTCPNALNWSTVREMQLTVQPDGDGSVLIAEGMIDAGLPARLEAALQDRNIREVRLRSAGGDAEAGNEAGRVIRRYRVNTIIPPGWACSGACAFMFMGGVSRRVAPGGFFITQMFTHTGDRATIRREIEAGPERTQRLLDEIALRSADRATRDSTYLTQMGVSRRLLTDIVYRQRAVPRPGDHSTRRCLTEAELAEYDVVTQSPR